MPAQTRRRDRQPSSRDEAPGPGSPHPANPADNTGFTRPLARELSWHAARLARQMPEEEAVAWVYMTVLAAWAEDHGLISPWLRAPAAPRRDEWLAVTGENDVGWQARAMAALCCHPSTWSLLDPRWTPLRKGRPSAAACRDLSAWWEHDAPSLAFAAAAGPASITGWLPGDLLQHLSARRRSQYALVQTPWWVADFILDRTLLPAAAEFRDAPLRAIDPCCGTGHFLVRAIGCLWEWYTTGTLAPRSGQQIEPARGGTPVPPAAAAALILQGLHGADRDPLTTAVARLRYTVTLGALMHDAGLISGPLRLDRIPPFQVPVVPADSLLAHQITSGEYAALHPGLAAIANLGTQVPRPAGA